MTVIEPPGRSTRRRAASAPAGSVRCSRTKQTKTWSKEPAGNGSANTSPLRNSTLARPRFRTSSRAAATESRETSIEMNAAPGLAAARMTVCAPTPQPTSSTWLPAG